MKIGGGRGLGHCQSASESNAIKKKKVDFHLNQQK